MKEKKLVEILRKIKIKEPKPSSYIEYSIPIFKVPGVDFRNVSPPFITYQITSFNTIPGDDRVANISKNFLVRGYSFAEPWILSRAIELVLDKEGVFYTKEAPYFMEEYGELYVVSYYI